MFSLSCDPIAMAVLGLGGVVVGMTELGLSFVRRFPTWKISLGLAAVLALAGGGAFARGEGRYSGCRPSSWPASRWRCCCSARVTRSPAAPSCRGRV